MHLKDYQPKNVQAPRPAPDGFPNKVSLSLLYSSKGTGKTNTLCNILDAYDKYRFYQRVYLFSPSLHSDPKYEELKKGSYELKTYDHYSDELLKEVIDEIRSGLDEWNDYERKRALYEKSRKIKSLDTLKEDELLDLWEMDWSSPPKPRWDKEPWSLIIFDDLASDRSLMKSGKTFANSVWLLHRHIRTGVAFCSQIFRNSVPKMVRNNLDWYILGKSKSKENMESVAQELDSYASKNEIMQMWEKATEEPFSYFCVNLMNPKYRFTKNFDEPINP